MNQAMEIVEQVGEGASVDSPRPRIAPSAFAPDARRLVQAVLDLTRATLPAGVPAFSWYSTPPESAPPHRPHLELAWRFHLPPRASGEFTRAIGVNDLLRVTLISRGLTDIDYDAATAALARTRISLGVCAITLQRVPASSQPGRAFLIHQTT